MTRLIETQALDEALALVEGGREVATAIRAMPKPVIAAHQWPGGGRGANLALACDLRLASETATIGQTFNRIGLHPDWGGTYVVPRLVGPARAAELFFFAEMIPAAEAERMGLVNRVVPADELMPLAREWARRLARKPAPPPAAPRRRRSGAPSPPASRRCSTTRPPRSGPASRPTTPSKGSGVRRETQTRLRRETGGKTG